MHARVMLVLRWNICVERVMRVVKYLRIIVRYIPYTSIPYTDKIIRGDNVPTLRASPLRLFTAYALCYLFRECDKCEKCRRKLA